MCSHLHIFARVQAIPVSHIPPPAEVGTFARRRRNLRARGAVWLSQSKLPAVLWRAPFRVACVAMGELDIHSTSVAQGNICLAVLAYTCERLVRGRNRGVCGCPDMLSEYISCMCVQIRGVRETARGGPVDVYTFHRHREGCLCRDVIRRIETTLCDVFYFKFFQIHACGGGWR